MGTVDISIVIVSYNTKDDLRNCLKALLVEQLSMQIFVVDNASSDGTQHMLKKEFHNIPALNVIYNQKNIGFAPACNQPIPLCIGRYVLFLNPDTVVKPCSMKAMINCLDSEHHAGIIGPRLVYSDGNYQYSYGSDWTVFRTIVWHIIPLGLRERLQSKWLNILGKGDRPLEVGWVSGACLMIRRKLVVELGGFDDQIFLSLTDCGDLCVRARKKGYHTIFFPKAEVIHLSGQSYRDTRVKPIALIRAYQGHLYYHMKHHGQVSVLLLRLMFSLISLDKAILAGLLGLFRPMMYLGKAQAHFIAALKILFTPISGKNQADSKISIG